MEPPPLALPNLAPDIILEILTWTSLKGVGRCRLISKDWNLITYSSSFMKQHQQRTKTLSGFFMQSKFETNLMPQFISDNNLDTDSSNLSLRFLPGPVRIETATKQGILLCVDCYPKNRPKIPEYYYVCKPSTQEWCKIPNPKPRSNIIATGMVVLGSKPFRYKIVRFLTPTTTPSIGNYHCRCEIFDSKTCTWRQLKDVISLPQGNFFRFASAVSVSGTLYWLLTNDNNNVLAYNVATESWRVFELPFPLCNRKYFWYRKIVDYSGRLAMLCMISRTSTDMQLWVMEDLRTKVWSLRQTISIQQPLPKEDYYFPCAFLSSDVLLLLGGHTAVSYNFETFSCNIVRLRLECGGQQQIFPIFSDLESVGLGDNF
jgi:F-box interacting protein